MKQETITFTASDGTSVEYYILEQTRISGTNYILVTDSQEDDAQAYILKDLSKDEETESLYEEVTDETELSAVADIFTDLLDDIDLL